MTVTSLLQRPAPPGELTEDQATIWREIVDALPADWFPVGSWPLLAAYCRIVIQARYLDRLIATTRLDPSDKASMRRYCRLAAVSVNQARLLCTLATKLRMTPQSRYTPKSAATAARRGSGRRPWEPQV